MKKFRELFNNLFKVIKLAFSMAKGDKSFHTIGLTLLIALFGWLTFSDNLPSIPSINVILQAHKVIFLVIMGVLAFNFSFLTLEADL